MSLWAVIPMRGFVAGKSRLAAVLDDHARTALNRRLLMQTATCVSDIFGTERIIVVSPDERVIEAAAKLGLMALSEPVGAGLNGALTLARMMAADCGATGLFSVSCDLPLLTAEDVATTCDAWRGPGSVVIGGDIASTGTNALIVGIGAKFAYSMGSDSAAQHRHQSQENGLTVIEPNVQGLRFDLDTPADLLRWRSMGERRCNSIRMTA